MNDGERNAPAPVTDRRVWYGLLALCAVLFLADALYHQHAKVELANWFGFYAIFGFLAAAAVALLARLLRRLVRRPGDYYGEGDG